MFKTQVLCYSLLLLLVSTTFSQDTITITGTIKDHYTQQRLPYANVSIKGTYIGTSTNDKGKFHLKIPEAFLPFELQAGYMGYQDTTILVTKTRNQNIDVNLYAKSIDLYEVTVNSEKNVIFGDQKFQVLDFLVLEDRILLMYFKGKLSRSVLVMTDLEGNTIQAIPIRGKPIQLYTDCVNKPFLVCQSLPYIIHVKDSSLSLQRAYQDRFNKLMKPCVASIEPRVGQG